jgi:membrane-bound lytic murein transglycosylase A
MLMKAVPRIAMSQIAMSQIAMQITIAIFWGGLSGLNADPIFPTPTPVSPSLPAVLPKPAEVRPVEVKPVRPKIPQPTLRKLSEPPGGLGLASLGLDDQVISDRSRLLQSLDRSIRYLQTDAATVAYRRYPVSGVTRDRVLRSVRRFRTLVTTAKTAEALQKQVIQEFSFYESSGKDGAGTVGFTGYFEPVYVASRQPSETFRYPLYRQPSGFELWEKPHPTRAALEGKDGLQASSGLLKGAELVWMRDRLEAFLVQVQGSARLELTDGTQMSIGFDGNTDYPYVGIGREMVKDKKFSLEDLTLPKIAQHFKDHPADLDEYLPRNNRFVFFRNTQGALATGSLGFPVTAGRSIATDKKKMPPGALALIATTLPDDQLQPQVVNRFVLDQDTGGAIIGPGRVDIFMGTGDLAKGKAGLVRSEGKLYYLLLKR